MGHALNMDSGISTNFAGDLILCYSWRPHLKTSDLEDHIYGVMAFWFQPLLCMLTLLHVFQDTGFSHIFPLFSISKYTTSSDAW